MGYAVITSTSANAQAIAIASLPLISSSFSDSYSLGCVVAISPPRPEGLARRIHLRDGSHVCEFLI